MKVTNHVEAKEGFKLSWVNRVELKLAREGRFFNETKRGKVGRVEGGSSPPPPERFPPADPPLFLSFQLTWAEILQPILAARGVYAKKTREEVHTGAAV